MIDFLSSEFYVLLVGIFFIFIYFKLKSSKIPKLKEGEKRFVGNLGRYRIVRNELDLYYGFSTGVQLQSRDPINQIKTNIISASHRWYKTFECLNVVIDDPNSNHPMFIEKKDYNSPTNFPIEFVIRDDPNTIERVIITEHNRRWKLTKWLWRLIVIVPPNSPPLGELVNFDLVLSSSHLISDGMSNLALLEKLIESYNEIDQPLPPLRPLTKSVEELVDLRPKLWFLIKTFVQKKILINFLPVSMIEPPYYTGRKIIPNAERKGCPTEGVFIEYSEEIIKKLQLKAKENNTTVHGIICAASIKALAKEVPNNQLVKVSSPVDLRSSIPYDHKQVGDWVAAVDISYNPRESFWNLARKTKHDIVTHLSEAKQVDGLLAYIGSDWNGFWLSQKALNPNGRNSTLSISNLGVCKWSKQYGGLFVNRCLFSQGNSAIGSLYQLSIVTHQKMTISFT